MGKTLLNLIYFATSPLHSAPSTPVPLEVQSAIELHYHHIIIIITIIIIIIIITIIIIKIIIKTDNIRNESCWDTYLRYLS